MDLKTFGVLSLLTMTFGSLGAALTNALVSQGGGHGFLFWATQTWLGIAILTDRPMQAIAALSLSVGLAYHADVRNGRR